MVRCRGECSFVSTMAGQVCERCGGRPIFRGPELPVEMPLKPHRVTAGGPMAACQRCGAVVAAGQASDVCPNQPGWRIVGARRRAHYFTGRARKSLCGDFFSPFDLAPVAGTRERDRCAACVRKEAAQAEADAERL